jgi:hypothetical protein
MVIVDLPGNLGVYESLALAGHGYRPVPLYNGVCGPNHYSMIVEVKDIVEALSDGANILSELNIRYDAPPAFMLDSNRMKGFGKAPGDYDNRWCIFAQDMPSAQFLYKNNIRKIIIRSDSIQNDLSHIVYRYKEHGIKIYLCKGKGPCKETAIPKPSQFKSLFFRFEVLSGLTRNATGGFGGVVPEPLGCLFGGRSYHGIG